MHDTAYEIGRLFFQRYVPSTPTVVVEVGSYDVNGSLRDFKRPEMTYIGLDFDVGPGVDIRVGSRAPHLPLRDSCAEIVASSSAFEHDGMFWMTFLEIVRVLKPNGYMYVSSPSNGKFHRYPRDYWRFYPDAGFALETWGRKNGYELTLIECFTANRKSDVWNDFCAIFLKANSPAGYLPPPIAFDVPATNIFLYGRSDAMNYKEETEDMRLLSKVVTERNVWRARCAQLEAQIRELTKAC